MEMYGIETVESFDADNFQKEKLSYPVVLKIDSDKVLHKTDKGGLILGIENEENLTRAISQMKTSFPGSRFIIQPMTKSGAEIIVGIKRDENFGPVVVYGLGGIYTEILKTVDYVVPPLALSQIERSLEEGKIKFLFQGVRGQKKYDLQELSRILIGVSSMSLEIPEISEFDINPLIVYNNGNEALALDVKIII
jgi:acetyltransferase